MRINERYRSNGTIVMNPPKDNTWRHRQSFRRLRELGSIRHVVYKSPRLPTPGNTTPHAYKNCLFRRCCSLNENPLHSKTKRTNGMMLTAQVLNSLLNIYLKKAGTKTKTKKHPCHDVITCFQECNPLLLLFFIKKVFSFFFSRQLRFFFSF